MKDKIGTFADYVRSAQSIAFFGGAGVSTESGLPDYRSHNGVYTAMENKGKDPKKVMHINYLLNHPKEFFKRREDDREIKPNPAHKALATLEKMGKEVHVITQNVDSLHQKAGSTSVYELHGANRTWFCMDCGQEVKEDEVVFEDDLPTCQNCSGLMRPSVTYFGEMPNRETTEAARSLISQADLLIIAGTSLTVSPAKSLITAFKGDHTVVINREAIKPVRISVDLNFQESVGVIMQELIDRIQKGE